MKTYNLRLLGSLLILSMLLVPLTLAEEEDGFPVSGWRQRAKLSASDPAFYDSFGEAVALSGDYAFIGAPNDDDFTGSVYVFKRTCGSWLQVDKLRASDASLYSWFGISVAAYDKYLLVGSPDSNELIGSAYVFQFDGNNWTEQCQLTPSDGEPMDTFGHSVALYENYALIGAPYENVQNGSAYVFKREGTLWTEEAKLSLKVGYSTFGETFGQSVAIYGDIALISAPLNDYTIGSAHIFKRTGSTWVEVQKLSPSDGGMYDWFGQALALHDGFAFINANNDGYGAVYVFTQTETGWVEEQKLLVEDGVEGDGFGYSISLDTKYAVIGAPFKERSEGAAYVFKRDDSIWIQEAMMNASDPFEESFFGQAVSIQGNTLLVGRPDWYWGIGSAYIFTKFIPPTRAVGIIE